MGRTLDVPLSALWARTLAGYAHDYEANERVPPLPLWSNLLRVVTGAGVGLTEMPRLARVSRRTMGPLVAHGERTGLVVVDRSGGRGRATVHLTDSGRAARENGAALLGRTDGLWGNRLGAHGARLRDGLETLVGRLDLEHPHFPATYGPRRADQTPLERWGAGPRLVVADVLTARLGGRVRRV